LPVGKTNIESVGAKLRIWIFLIEAVDERNVRVVDCRYFRIRRFSPTIQNHQDYFLVHSSLFSTKIKIMKKKCEKNLILQRIVVDEITHADTEYGIDVVVEQVVDIGAKVPVDGRPVVAHVISVKHRYLAPGGKPPRIRQIEIPKIQVLIVC